MARIREPAPPPTTRVMGRYRLVEPIGSGAFGTVWRAVDENLSREVAIKAIPAELAGERAEREIRAAARLSHPGVVTLHEASADSTHTYIVSEFVRGSTLAQLYSQDSCSDRDVVRIGAALAGALDHAHGHGVVHRDVKPGNILIPDAPRSEAGIVKLADFGIARLAGESSLTRTGDVVGTLAYMAPEQAAGHNAGPSADLWALALIVFEGLSGANPIRGATPAQTARNLSDGPPESLGQERPDLPDELIEAIDDALEHDPSDRGRIADLGSVLGWAVSELDDAPGSIAPAVRRGGRGLTVRRRSTAPSRSRDAVPSWEPDERMADGALHHQLRTAVGPRGQGQWTGGSSSSGLKGRMLASAGAALLSLGWSVTLATPAMARDKWWIAAVTAGVVALLPRLGFIMMAAAGVVGIAASGQPGTAVMFAAALAPAAVVALFLPAWPSLPALAPALGWVGFAGAWPALAAFGPSAVSRAALGALGAWQLGCAEVIFGRTFLGAPMTSAAPLWADDPVAAVSDALMGLLTGPTPALAGAWAVGAVVLPLMVRGRSVVGDALAGTLWAVAVGAASAFLTGGVSHGVFAGTLAGGAIAVVAAGWARPATEARVGALPTS